MPVNESSMSSLILMVSPPLTPGCRSASCRPSITAFLLADCLPNLDSHNLGRGAGARFVLLPSLRLKQNKHFTDIDKKRKERTSSEFLKLFSSVKSSVIESCDIMGDEIRIIPYCPPSFYPALLYSTS